MPDGRRCQRYHLRWPRDRRYRRWYASSTMPDTLVAYLATLAAHHAELAAALQGIDGLSGVLEWGKREGLSVAAIEIVTMDEYTHDAILAWHEKFIVFGVT